MRAALILFDDLTLLDFVGFYDPLTRLRSQGHLPDLTWDTCALTPKVTDNHGLVVTVDRVRPDLGDYDLLFVPGGFGTRSLSHYAAFVEWLRTAAPVPLKASVCTGALLLGAAGFLTDHRATTHYGEYETLAPYCRRVVRDATVVDDGPVVTAGAVAASLDLGLHVCERLAGRQAAEAIRHGMGLGKQP